MDRGEILKTMLLAQLTQHRPARPRRLVDAEAGGLLMTTS